MMLLARKTQAFGKTHTLLLGACWSCASVLLQAAPITGTFVQKKHLTDVDVTLTSTGKFIFDVGKSFTWHTLKPVESTFIATPTNYTMQVGDDVRSIPLETDVTSIEKIFTVREVKAFVKRIETNPPNPPPNTLPNSVKIIFKNGDVTDVALSPNSTDLP